MSAGLAQLTQLFADGGLWVKLLRASLDPR